jgi:DNA (cytosine-5)-methyltransferase 1
MPRLLDLFCGAGGCAWGYRMAGFEIVGVDIESQNYPFEFHQADAVGFPVEGFDAVHASPPCQMYSRAMKHLSAPQPMLIDAIREKLIASGLPWVIENVEGAPLPTQSTLDGRHGVELCGSMFGLPIFRHRLFEASFPIEPPAGCGHKTLAMNPHNEPGRQRIYETYGRGQHPEAPWREAMGVGWMERYEAREAVPPAFTAHIGRYLAAEVRRVSVLQEAA